MLSNAWKATINLISSFLILEELGELKILFELLSMISHPCEQDYATDWIEEFKASVT